MKLEKSFIAKNWMKILRVLGYITIGLIIFFKFTAPKTIIPDYIEYGKDIVSGDGTGVIGSTVGSLFSKTFSSLDAISPQLTTIVSILVIAILAIVTLHMFMDKKPDKKKK